MEICTPQAIPEVRSRIHDRRRAYAVAVFALVVVGAAIRVILAHRAAVSYDEVHVMGFGLQELVRSGREFWIDLPLRRSNAIAPLWWWLQAIPCACTGLVSLPALRLLPVLIGSATPACVWWAAAPRLGRRSALVLCGLVALSDVHAFASTRGECVEPLLVLCALVSACWIGGWRRPLAKVILWSFLPLTHLIKGGAILLLLVVGEILFRVVRQRGRSVGAIVAYGFAACIPISIWLAAASVTAFADGPILADAGEFGGLGAYLASLTTQYVATKGHMVATAWDAAMPFFDGRLWPLTALIFIPLVTAIGVAAVGTIRSLLQGHRNRRVSLFVALLPWSIVGCWLVIGRGLTGSRFHLLYLPAWWLLGSLALAARGSARITRSDSEPSSPATRLDARRIDVHPERGRPRRRFAPACLVILVAVWIVHLLFAFSVTSWTRREWRFDVLTALHAGVALAACLGIAIALAEGLFGRMWSVRVRVLLFGLSTAIGGLLMRELGPIAWGPSARFEPAPGSRVGDIPTALEDLDAAWSRERRFPGPDRTPFWVYMSNAHLTRPNRTAADAEWAIRYARAAIAANPADAQAWAYLGFASQSAGRPTAEIRSAWIRSHELRPDARLAEQIRRLDERP